MGYYLPHIEVIAYNGWRVSEVLCVSEGFGRSVEGMKPDTRLLGVGDSSEVDGGRISFPYNLRTFI